MVLAVGYLFGLLVTGDAVFRLQLGLPAGSGAKPARTADYWTAARGRPLPTGVAPVAGLSVELPSLRAGVAARVVAAVPARLAARVPAGDGPAVTAAVTPGTAAAAGSEHRGSGRQEERKLAR